MSNEKIQEFLTLVDAWNSMCVFSREMLAHAECALFACTNGDDKAVALDAYMISSFDYFSKKFNYFWFEDVSFEVFVARQKPEIELFSGHDFELLVRAILYLVEEREYKLTQASHDQGIDLYCEEPAYKAGSTVGYLKWPVVQCKLLRGLIPISHIRDFYGVLTNEIAEGYFFTTGELTNAGIHFISKARMSTPSTVFRFVGKNQLALLLDICREIVQHREALDDLSLGDEDDPTGEDEDRRISNAIESLQGKAKVLIQMHPRTESQLRFI